GEEEETLPDLDEAAAVVAVGERAEGDAEEEERRPVADDREARERGRVEALEDEPVGDDVLDVVGHHRHEAGREVRAKVRVPQRRERLASRRDYCGGQRTFSSAAAGILRRACTPRPTTTKTR